MLPGVDKKGDRRRVKVLIVLQLIALINRHKANSNFIVSGRISRSNENSAPSVSMCRLLIESEARE